jgi:hypothetical protein
METYNVATISAILGSVAGFWFCKFKTRSDRHYDYARGHSDATNALWPYIIRCWVNELAALRSVKPTASAAGSDGGGAGQDV